MPRWFTGPAHDARAPHIRTDCSPHERSDMRGNPGYRLRLIRATERAERFAHPPARHWSPAIRKYAIPCCQRWIVARMSEATCGVIADVGYASSGLSHLRKL